MKQRTKKQIRSIERKVRLTTEEYEMFREKSERYHTMAGMIRDAVRLFDDKATKRKLESVTEVKDFYVRFDQRLGWIGSNLNQAQHRANELAIEGQLSSDYIQRILEPEIGETLRLIREIRSDLEQLRQHLLRL